MDTAETLGACIDVFRTSAAYLLLNSIEPMNKFHRIRTEQEYQEAAERSTRQPVILYKHSNLCDLCFLAQAELEMLNEEGDPPIYQVVVQEARPLSNSIEATLGIRHESPQVILLYDRKPVFHASHRAVTAAAVRGATEDLAASHA